MNSTPVDYQFNYGGAVSQTQKIETNQRHLSERRDNVLREVIEMEVKMGIAHRWQAGDQEYLKTLTYIKERQYQRALDELRQLVVQRLFELHKLTLSQIVMSKFGSGPVRPLLAKPRTEPAVRFGW
jgi:hypothetical protein